jgi:hypothetical protein
VTWVVIAAARTKKPARAEQVANMQEQGQGQVDVCIPWIRKSK